MSRRGLQRIPGLGGIFKNWVRTSRRLELSELPELFQNQNFFKNYFKKEQQNYIHKNNSESAEFLEPNDSVDHH